jgi:hypothetical protein
LLSRLLQDKPEAAGKGKKFKEKEDEEEMEDVKEVTYALLTLAVCELMISSDPNTVNRVNESIE